MSQRPLHQIYPRLDRILPHLELAELPTPLVEFETSGTEMLAKLDGATSPLYGGNKVRKLEYLLGQAKRHGCTTVATFGAAGSNHATATAVHAHAVGLRCVNFLSRQRRTPWVADNLWRQLHADADIVFVTGTRAQREQQAQQWIEHCAERVWQVPMGGSSIAGALGYVNAGLELAAQLANTALPDRIYVPLGTMGTAVGLAVGLRLAGLTLPIHAVRVVHETIGSAARAPQMFAKVVRLLRRLDDTVPRIAFDHQLFVVRDEFFGNGYAHATDAALAAMNLAAQRFELRLETTYSAKALAALLHDQQGASRARRVLLWCTYTHSASAAMTEQPALLSRLPEPLHHYLETRSFVDILPP